MEKNLISTEKVSTNSRTFFFDLKKASNGKPYLVVTETRKSKDKEGEFQRNSIMLFREEAEPFRAALERMYEQMKDTAEA